LIHPVFVAGDAEVCVFSAEPQKQYRAAFAERQVRGVAKVIGVEKLRKNYGQFEQRRKLCDSYDLFVADRRILPRLPSLLGQRFFATKKFPLFISLEDGADWQAEIDGALRCVSLTLAGGGTLNVKVGRVGDKHANVAANIVAGMDSIVTHIGGWPNVRSLFIKTPLSMAVPIFTAAPLARDAELELRKQLLAASADVQTHGPDAVKARKQAKADFEARLATDPRGEKKREYSFLTTEYGIEIEDDLLSDSTEDGGDVGSRHCGRQVESQPAKKAKKTHNDDDDDDDDEDDDDG
jgi:ribosome biogenesis protein UTP30